MRRLLGQFLVVYCFVCNANFALALGWTQQVSGTDVALEDVKFVNADTGWVCGEEGTILHTVDGGQTWTPQFSTTSYRLTTLAFPDANHGWACGDAGILRRTTNGGTSWSFQLTGSMGWIYWGMSFVDATHGWIAHGSDSVLVTTNAGTNWVQHPIGAGSNPMSIDMVNLTTGWLVRYDGSILRTTNGGTSWLPQVSGTTSHLMEVDFVNVNEGWAVGWEDGVILHTSNGGSDWSPQLSGAELVFGAVEFVDNQHGWAAGYGIYHTTDGGVNWTQQAGDSIPTIYDLHAVDANRCYAVGAEGTILRYDGDSDAPEQPSPSPAEFQLASVFPNPFNATTTIRLIVPPGLSTVKLTVFNTLGQAVRELTLSGLHGSVDYSLSLDAAPSGLYFLAAEAGSARAAQKLLLLK